MIVFIVTKLYVQFVVLVKFCEIIGQNRIVKFRQLPIIGALVFTSHCSSKRKPHIHMENGKPKVRCKYHGMSFG